MNLSIIQIQDKKSEDRDSNHHNYVIFDANKVKITKREEIGNNETV